MKRLLFWLAIILFCISVIPIIGTASGETKTIVLWSMVNEPEPFATVQKKWIEDYKEINPDIDFEVVFAGREVVTKVMVSRGAGVTIDLINMEGFVLRGALVIEGISSALDNALDKPDYKGEKPWRESFIPGILEQYAADDGTIHLIPFGVHTSGFFYDKKMWQEHGWKVPKTWDEFLELCETIKTTTDIAPITHDCGVDFYNDIWNYQIMARLKGPGAIMAAVEDKTGESWDDPAFKRAIEMEQELFDKGYIIEGAKGFTWPAGQGFLASGEAAMNLNGTWLPNELKHQVDEDFEWGSFPFPEVVGGVGTFKDMESSWNGWAVFADSEVSDEVVDFLKFVTTVDNQEFMVETSWNLSPILGADMPDWSLGEGLGQALAQAENLFDRHDGLAGRYPEYYKNIYLKNHDRAFLGEITPEEYVQIMKEETIKYWEER